jgi:hypothetical protein
MQARRSPGPGAATSQLYRRANLLVSALCIATVLTGCGDPEKPVASPPAPTATVGAATAPPPVTSAAAAETPPSPGDLVSQLKSSKITLAQGIQQAEKDNGPAISAKLELDEGHLSLSVYTAKAGLDKDAEHNVLMELSGDPTKDKWEPKSEVFSDKAHITRAATHLTLVQRAKTTLSAIVAKASAREPGLVYSVTPAVKDKKPGFEVLVATPAGKSVTVTIDGG